MVIQNLNAIIVFVLVFMQLKCDFHLILISLVCLCFLQGCVVGFRKCRGSAKYEAHVNRLAQRPGPNDEIVIERFGYQQRIFHDLKQIKNDSVICKMFCFPLLLCSLIMFFFYHLFSKKSWLPAQWLTVSPLHNRTASYRNLYAK